MKRRIAVITVARSDYFIMRTLLGLLRDDPAVELLLLVTGMHLAPEFGHTVDAIEADGFTVTEKVESLVASDQPGGMARSMGLGTLAMTAVLERLRPDLVVVMGDRFEMFAAALPCLPLRIPVAHLHGGERTQGAIDDPLRHMLTKLSHLHFTSTEEYARRVIQMGEEPWRVMVSGAPGLDNIAQFPVLDRAALEARVGMSLERPPLLVTFHPVTTEHDDNPRQVQALLDALAQSGHPVVFTLPNADAAGRQVAAQIRAALGQRPHWRLVDNLGGPAYFSMMRLGLAMVGNSSSGIIEAASFRLPVVNIGSRQGGRVRGANVLDAEPRAGAIAEAITRATSPGFRAGLADLVNPYGDGQASPRVLERLKRVELGPDLVNKPFHDLP